nr:glycosyltransferase [Aromatoleum diolicum]
MINAVDDWAARKPGAEIFAQIGPSLRKPRQFESVAMLPPDRAMQLFVGADVIVSHAGMGSILTALKFRKPIIIMPRRAELGEHRNDHQVATAKWLAGRTGIHVASDAQELERLLNQGMALAAGSELSDGADPKFISRLEAVISRN